MARNPVSVFKRPTARKGQFTYYIKVWLEEQGKYDTPHSAHSIALELALDPKRFPPTSRTGAILIGHELLRRGGELQKRDDLLLADYCEAFWQWDSAYIQGRLARGLRIGREHAKHCAAYAHNYIRPAFPAMKLSAVQAHHVEAFIMSIKKTGKIGNRSINAILDTLRTPLKEAERLGLIPSNPAKTINKLADDRKPKGIPSEQELTAILSLAGLDQRFRCAIMLSAACSLRLGEILALKPEYLEGNTVHIKHSWSKVDGLKSTKTGKDRTVPLPTIIHDELKLLAAANIHGKDGFYMYGLLPNKPINCRAIERGFDDALVQLQLGDQYATATKDERSEALKKWRARGITFHSLRHFANAHLRGAVPDETLRKLTGHATEAMTDRYDHTTAADLKALAEAQESRILPFIKTA